MKMSNVLLGALFFIYSISVYANPVELVIDHEHSHISFKVRHLFTKVMGSFESYKGSIKMDPKDLSTLKTKLEIETKSIQTKVKERDNHLRSADFFDSKKFPKLVLNQKK